MRIAIDFHRRAIGSFSSSLLPLLARLLSLFFFMSHLLHFVSGLSRGCSNLAGVFARRLGAQCLFSPESIEIFLMTVKAT